MAMAEQLGLDEDEDRDGDMDGLSQQEASQRRLSFKFLGGYSESDGSRCLSRSPEKTKLG